MRLFRSWRRGRIVRVCALRSLSIAGIAWCKTKNKVSHLDVPRIIRSLNGILVFLLIKTLYLRRFLAARNQALLMSLIYDALFCLQALTSDSRRFLIFLKLLLIKQQLVMLANSVVVATNWRIQAHKQEDYNAENNDKLGMIAREIKCVVFKLYQRSYAELRFIGSFRLLTMLGPLTSFGLLSSINSLNRMWFS